VNDTATPKPAQAAPLLADLLDLETTRARAIATALEHFPPTIRHDKAIAALQARRAELATYVDAHAERFGPGTPMTLDRVCARDDVSVELQVIILDAAIACDRPATA